MSAYSRKPHPTKTQAASCFSKLATTPFPYPITQLLEDLATARETMEAGRERWRTEGTYYTTNVAQEHFQQRCFKSKSSGTKSKSAYRNMSKGAWQSRMVARKQAAANELRQEAEAAEAAAAGRRRRSSSGSSS